jgi:DNA-binding GntR family transcriptional regulator
MSVTAEAVTAKPLPPRSREVRARLSEEAADHVRELVMKGLLPPGARVWPDKIAAELGISVTPVREGLLSLHGQGFLILQPRRGFVVGPMSGDDIRDLFTGHALLAGELASRAVRLATSDTISELEIVQSQLEAAAGAGDIEAVEHWNHQFHRVINLTASAPKVAWMLAGSAQFAPRRFYTSIPGWVEASTDDHQAILGALRLRDVAVARAAMFGHIERAGERLARQFERSLLTGGGTADANVDSSADRAVALAPASG